ncbi:MAG: hypothetical protein Q9163_000821 [Psora crenata]
MADTKTQSSAGVRRRSMLPQLLPKDGTRLPLPSPTRLRKTPAGDDSLKDEEIGVGLGTEAQETGAPAVDRKSSMPRPPIPGPLRSSHAPLNNQGASRPSLSSSMRKPTTVRASSPNDPLASGRSRASSGTKLLSNPPEAASHGRSLSHQITSTSVRVPNKTAPSAPAIRSTSMKLQKPAFSTFQQHYSPRKGPSRLPPVPLKKAAQQTDPDATADNIRSLELELLQLHVMHRAAPNVQRQWEESARSHFRKRYDDLCVRNVELKEIAHQQQTLLNQLALVEWCQGIPSSQVAEKVRTLSRNIADLKMLLDHDGRYMRVLAVFQSWFKQAQTTQSLRQTRNEDDRHSKDLTFIEGIGDGWKAEAMVLERELTYCSRDLKIFGDVRIDSSLGSIVSLHKTLLANLLDELDIVLWIEDHVMAEEAVWMEDTIQKLSSNITNGMGV